MNRIIINLEQRRDSRYSCSLKGDNRCYPIFQEAQSFFNVAVTIDDLFSSFLEQ